MRQERSRSFSSQGAALAGAMAVVVMWMLPPAPARAQDSKPLDVQQKIDGALNALNLPSPALAHLPVPKMIGPPVTGQPYQQQPAAAGGSSGGGSGGSGGAFSDLRLKKDVVHLATLENGIKVYAFKYLWNEAIHVGVMAQDLLADPVRSQAVIVMPNGFYAVDYAKLGLRMTTLAAWRASGVIALFSQSAGALAAAHH